MSDVRLKQIAEAVVRAHCCPGSHYPLQGINAQRRRIGLPTFEPEYRMVLAGLERLQAEHNSRAQTQLQIEDAIEAGDGGRREPDGASRVR